MSKPKLHVVETTKEDKAVAALMNAGHTDRLWKKLDVHQRAYVEAIRKHIVTFVDAAAGTGKTTVAVMEGLNMLRSGQVDQITYMRFPDPRSGNLGYLPGFVEDKVRPMMAPFYEALAECGLQPEVVAELCAKGTLEMVTDTYMRGRNKRTYLIIDEAQNARSAVDLQLILTRLHDDRSRGIVIGHSEQVDGKVERYGTERLIAFQVYQQHMRKKSFTATVDLPNNYRGKVSQWADKIGITLSELK
jgi:phosphate starvation-inducible protein PhoH